MNTRFRIFSLLALFCLLLLSLSAPIVSAQTYDYTVLYVSARGAGVTEDGLAYDAGDIIGTEGAGAPWFMFFDASEHGLASQNVNAFDFAAAHPTGNAVLPGEPIYMTFSQPRVRVPGVPGWVRANDVVRFEAPLVSAVGGEFELLFDGSDVGLTTRAEQIDSLSVWPSADVSAQDVSVPADCTAGVLFISTAANYRVPGADGSSLAGKGGDILIFCATNLGQDTAGFWLKGFDAAAAGFAPLRALRNVSVNQFDYSVNANQWNLVFSFSSWTSFMAGSFPGEANVIYLYDTGAGGVLGPVRDLNYDYPTLNGAADGLLIDQYLSPCANSC